MTHGAASVFLSKRSLTEGKESKYLLINFAKKHKSESKKVSLLAKKCYLNR